MNIFLKFCFLIFILINLGSNDGSAQQTQNIGKNCNEYKNKSLQFRDVMVLDFWSAATSGVLIAVYVVAGIILFIIVAGLIILIVYIICWC